MLCEFINDLLNGRRLRVGTPDQIDEDDVKKSIAQLRAFEALYRLEMPFDPPELDESAAVWAASVCYFSAGALVHRHLGEEQIDPFLKAPPPDRNRAAVHYAVDLTMRFLPQLIIMTKAAATDDPLLKCLMEWARAWPLSSVGVANVGSVDATPLRTSNALMCLYVNRIIASEDIGRLEDKSVAEAAAAALGGHPSLAPKIAAALMRFNNEVYE